MDGGKFKLGKRRNMCIGLLSKVWTRNGLDYISAIQQGDLVLTHKIRFRPVIAISKRYYDGNVISLTNRQGSLLVTPEQLVQCVTHITLPRRWAINPEHWKKAEEIEIKTLVSHYNSHENKGEPYKISAIKILEYRGMMYSLRIADDFTYVTENLNIYGHTEEGDKSV